MNCQFNFFRITLLVHVSLSTVLPPQECSVRMAKMGFGEEFPGAVAHGIHSITVDDLRLFNPQANMTNGVPMVNLDLISDIPILPNAPNAEIVPGGSFKTQGMQMVDRVLSNMDRKLYDVQGYSTLERLVHLMHMAETWYKALIEYKQLVQNNAAKDICPCLLDVDANGVTTALRKFALGMREPKLILGDTIASFGHKNLKYGYKQHRTGKVLLNPSDALQPLASTDRWAHWKKVFISKKPHYDRDIAYFLYCSLN